MIKVPRQPPEATTVVIQPVNTYWDILSNANITQDASAPLTALDSSMCPDWEYTPVPSELSAF